MQLMHSNTSLGCCCCVVFIENTEVAWCDSVSEDPGRQWTCSRSYLTGHYAQSLSDCLRRSWRGINTVCVSCPSLASSSSMWLACWEGPLKIHFALYSRLLNGLHSLTTISPIYTVCFLFFLCQHECYTFGSRWEQACTKHNSMRWSSLGDVHMSFCPLEIYEWEEK